MTEAKRKRRGRPKLYQERMAKISIRLPNSLIAIAQNLGGGQIGAGIRIALLAYVGMPTTEGGNTDGTDDTDTT